MADFTILHHSSVRTTLLKDNSLIFDSTAAKSHSRESVQKDVGMMEKGLPLPLLKII